jgi:hypothetical protein
VVFLHYNDDVLDLVHVSIGKNLSWYEKSLSRACVTTKGAIGAGVEPAGIGEVCAALVTEFARGSTRLNIIPIRIIFT